MKKVHAAAVALLFGVAAALGVHATTRTAGLGTPAQSQPASASIAGRAHQLDHLEVSLRRALRDRPPALPPPPASTFGRSSAPRVVYRRPAPIVVLKHRLGHDDGESEVEAGDD